ncbi:GNAT family N-acetyltransferase [Clostridium sp. Sa3CUN1]|uniref:GNAT family N-acetyltransferase n=1 Tax=Clostridium gallinarum TaxID=2762246 RepID=A0ABR8Q5S4_9CLOT|nr:GNAT family N-acetyltransferase [Clostridium gallinarum]MBD7915770.1 GNAT family N-acetyltransferase [Clostridium gallinarum]
MVGFDVRGMMKDDLEGIFKLNSEGSFSLINYQNDDKEHKILVAQLNDDIVGYIKYEILKGKNFKKGLIIKELVVDENYRGLGVGHQLMIEAEKVAKNYSIASLVILNNNYLEEEVIFYKRQGFNLNLDSRYEKKYYIQ